jgi:mono/diheme cytochrome c family protein
MAARSKRAAIVLFAGVVLITLAIVVVVSVATRRGRAERSLASAIARGGQAVYEANCAVCHGERGDGKGPAGIALSPAPRDFRLGLFKYAGIEDRGLPDDRELARIIRDGLPGAGMPPSDLSEDDVTSVIRYIKTFSLPGAGFQDKKLSVKAPAIPPDPFSLADRDMAIERGRKLYHSYFECAKCHPAYASPDDFRAWDSAPRADAPYLPAPKWSPAYQEVLIPTDFLRHDMRSVRSDPALRAADLYRVIAFGLAGPMPGYGHLGSEDVWAVAHYVADLLDSRDTPRGQTLEGQMAAWAK